MVVYYWLIDWLADDSCDCEGEIGHERGWGVSVLSHIKPSSAPIKPSLSCFRSRSIPSFSSAVSSDSGSGVEAI